LEAAVGDRLTETGLALGTPAYMSPEQASASTRLDGRSDQYSLACVVYEMLAGEPPYTGPTAQAVIAKRFGEPIPHLSTLRAVPLPIDAAITRALAKAPADRFVTAKDFGAALQERSEHQAEPRTQMSPRGWRHRLLVAGALVLLAAAGSYRLWWVWFPQRGPERVAHPPGSSAVAQPAASSPWAVPGTW
jgi:hypothetical protein